MKTLILFIVLSTSISAQHIVSFRVTALDMQNSGQDTTILRYVRAGYYTTRMVIAVDSGWTYQDSLRIKVNGKYLHATARSARDSTKQMIYDVTLSEAGDQVYVLRSGVTAEIKQPPRGSLLFHLFTIPVMNTVRHGSTQTTIVGE